jgi:histidine triad (HIT) family protein
MEQTIFEKIINREIPAHIVYEDEHTFAILDIKPKKLGHTLVITKKPYRNLLEIPDEVLEHYSKTIKKVSLAVKNALNSDGLNVTVNIESAGWQEVFHSHVHIIPRFHGDNMDLNPGTHEAYSSPEEMKEYADKIKAYLG